MGKTNPTDEAVIKASDNKYVKDVDGNSLIYKTEFYIAMYKLLEKGKSAAEAYTALGFDVKALGANRANKAAQKARKMAKEGSFYKPGSLDGSLSREEMGDMTPEQEVAWLKARNVYLERALEVEKKAPSILAKNYALLKQNEK